MGIKHLREENGSGLVLTLMVLLVLSVLGISIGTLTIGSYRLGAANRDATSAYYVAEAGAVTAYEEIQSQVLGVYNKNATEAAFYESISGMVSALPKQSSVDFDPQFGSKPIATITTARQDEKNYIITSTGEVDGKKRTVTKKFTVNWIEKNTGGGGSGLPVLPDKTALLVNEKMNLLGGTLKGNAYIQSIINDAVQMGTYGSFKESTLHYSNQTTADNLINYQDWFKDKLPNLSTQIQNINFDGYQYLLNQIFAPNITEKLPVKKIGNHMVQDENGNLNITNSQAVGYELKLEKDVYIPKVTSNSNRSFSINTNGNDRTILVDALELGGDIYLSGAGTLTIVVRNSFKINTGGISINKGGSPSKLTLVYLGSNELNLSNNIQINGHMIVKNANVKVNSIPINGVFLAGGNSVALSGKNTDSNMMLIAPNADVSLATSYSIKGTVIAKTFKIDGGDTSLIYKDIDTSGFPSGGTSAPAVDPELEDIINSEPIIEN